MDSAAAVFADGSSLAGGAAGRGAAGRGAAAGAPPRERVSWGGIDTRVTGAAAYRPREPSLLFSGICLRTYPKLPKSWFPLCMAGGVLLRVLDLWDDQMNENKIRAQRKALETDAPYRRRGACLHSPSR